MEKGVTRATSMINGQRQQRMLKHVSEPLAAFVMEEAIMYPAMMPKGTDAYEEI
jgi:hypothetical protein